MNQYMDVIWLIVSPTPLSFSAMKQFSHLRKRKKQPHKKGYLLGGFNPSEKYESNWIISPSRDENKTYLKPQSSYLLTMDPNLQPDRFSAPNCCPPVMAEVLRFPKPGPMGPSTAIGHGGVPGGFGVALGVNFLSACFLLPRRAWWIIYEHM